MQTQTSPSPSIQRVDIEPGMCVTVRVDPRSTFCCQAGEVRFTQTLMWVEGTPVQSTQNMLPGDHWSAETRGWVQLQAGAQGARLRIETAPARPSLLRSFVAWLMEPARTGALLR